MLYQARKTLGDYVNGIEITYGSYVETECLKWVGRMGPFLRPLSPGEKPKGKITVVKNTVEDVVIEEVVDEDSVMLEDTVIDEDTVDKTTTSRRKIKPLRHN